MYLLDTHAIIWYVSGSNELSSTAKNIMETKRCFFSFVLEERVDDSFVNKEVCVVDHEESVISGVPDKLNQTDIGRIVKIGEKKLIAFMPERDDVPIIPQKGKLGLYTAGDKSILKRRVAAKERMIKGRSPIKGIVSLIEAGSSGYSASSEWGSQKGITKEFRDNNKISYLVFSTSPPTFLLRACKEVETITVWKNI